METREQKSLKPLGSAFKQIYVKLGSGAGPRLYRELRKREAVFCDKGASIFAHAADRFRDPGWIAEEQQIIFRRAQEADNTQLDHQVFSFLSG